jgi:LPS-assembly protein
MLRALCPLIVHLLIGLACLSPAQLAAQALGDDQVRLVADSVSVTGKTRLVARGNIEVMYKGQRLRAYGVTYDRSGDLLIIEGPIRIDDEASGTVILADQAELDADLRNGIMASARLVLNRQMQMAAGDLRRVDGRYSVMRSVVASSCKVCAGDPTPLWEIRATRVIHDELGQQIYFDNANLRFGGIPVFFLPRMRVPDPTLKRSTGFLIPSLRTTSTQGFGMRLPFFWAITPNRDLTLTPYLTTQGVRSVDLRYRQAFGPGIFEARGAVSSDSTLGSPRLRGYLELDGQFRLPRGYRLTIDAEGVSDAGYFRDYGQPERDRLVSRTTLDRVGRDELIQARLHGFYSLRDTDDNTILPTGALDATWLRRLDLGDFGTAALRIQMQGHVRQSTSLLDSDLDGLADGRDVLRGSLRADWRKDWVFGPGIVLGALGQANVDLYGVAQDPVYSGSRTRTSSAFGLDLRWPFQRSNARTGTSEVIEPIAQLVWAHRDPTLVANEDSRLVEFDEGNLFALGRFSGADVVETGFRANLGMAYSRQAIDGTHLRMAVGRVFSGQPTTGFSAASGLSTQRSDWLLSMDVTTRNDISLLSRFLVGDTGQLTKGQFRLKMTRDRFDLAAGYSYVIADATEGRSVPLSEFALDSKITLNPNWAMKLDGRYDLTAGQPTRANLGLRYANECLAVDLSLSRRFTTSTSVTPTTTLGLSVELLGFGGSGAAGPARACRG